MSNIIFRQKQAEEAPDQEGEKKEEVDILEYVMRDPLLFGDYRNAVNEDEVRYYEDLLDYEAVYFLFQEIIEEYNERKGESVYPKCVRIFSCTNCQLEWDVSVSRSVWNKQLYVFFY